MIPKSILLVPPLVQIPLPTLVPFMKNCIVSPSLAPSSVNVSGSSPLQVRKPYLPPVCTVNVPHITPFGSIAIIIVPLVRVPPVIS